MSMEEKPNFCNQQLINNGSSKFSNLLIFLSNFRWDKIVASFVGISYEIVVERDNPSALNCY